MQRIVAVIYLIVGVIHLLPVTGVMGPAALRRLYGVPIDGASLELLMRHRAVLLGLVGALLVAAGLRPALRTAAALIGLGSMVSFIVLTLPIDTHPDPIARVFWIDVVAVALLTAAAAIERPWLRSPPTTDRRARRTS
jgi:hypothetical protein